MPFSRLVETLHSIHVVMRDSGHTPVERRRFYEAQQPFLLKVKNIASSIYETPFWKTDVAYHFGELWDLYREKDQEGVHPPDGVKKAWAEFQDWRVRHPLDALKEPGSKELTVTKPIVNKHVLEQKQEILELLNYIKGAYHELKQSEQ